MPFHNQERTSHTKIRSEKILQTNHVVKIKKGLYDMISIGNRNFYFITRNDTFSKYV